VTDFGETGKRLCGGKTLTGKLSGGIFVSCIQTPLQKDAVKCSSAILSELIGDHINVVLQCLSQNRCCFSFTLVRNADSLDFSPQPWWNFRQKSV
jgi:hypothetical protein